MLITVLWIENGHPVFSEISSRLVLSKMHPNYEIHVVALFLWQCIFSHLVVFRVA